MIRRLAAVALVAAPLLAGCGGGGNSSASPETVSSAAAKSAQAGSVKADFTISGGGANGEGSGTFNTGGDRSGQSTLNLTVNRRVNAVDTITTGKVLYLRSRVFAQAGISGAKDWLKVDLAQLAQQGGGGLSNLANVTPSPTTALAYLRGAKDAKKVGTESVAGADTTHYKVTADLQRAAARSSGSDKESIKQVMQLTGRKTLPMDAWVDGDGYLRKVTWAQQASAGAGAKISMVLHDFHAPVKIEPPSGHVIDLLQRLSGGG